MDKPYTNFSPLFKTFEEISKQYQSLKIDSIKEIKVPGCKITTKIDFQAGVFRHGNMVVHYSEWVPNRSARCYHFFQKAGQQFEDAINEEKLKLENKKDFFGDYFSSLLNEKAQAGLVIGKMSGKISNGNITVSLEEFLYSLFEEFFFEMDHVFIEFISAKIGNINILVDTSDRKPFDNHFYLKFKLIIPGENNTPVEIKMSKDKGYQSLSPVQTINLINFYYEYTDEIKLFFGELKKLIKYMQTEYTLKGV